MKLAAYRKSIAALIGVLSTWGLTAGADGRYSQVEWWGLLAAVGTVIAVFGAVNAPTKLPA